MRQVYRAGEKPSLAYSGNQLRPYERRPGAPRWSWPWVCARATCTRKRQGRSSTQRAAVTMRSDAAADEPQGRFADGVVYSSASQNAQDRDEVLELVMNLRSAVLFADITRIETAKRSQSACACRSAGAR